ncbi:MAG: FecR domain-containing protein [Burkholderiaceae bacterium]|nr:FecR domain-containing protein [Burkholderiaceae bacterium]
MKSTYLRFRSESVLLVLLSLLLLWSNVAMAAVAGYVQFAAGDVRIVDLAGKERAAQKGQPINEGETVLTAGGASAQLRMVDGGILALRPDTQLKVDLYTFSGAADGSENALLSLVRGGLRAITGLIGKTNKEKLKLQTPTAVIGIRGTDHEPVVLLASPPGTPAPNPPGTYDKVNVGATSLTTQVGTTVINANQIGYAASLTQQPVILPKLPDFYRATPTPVARQDKQGQQGSTQQGGQQGSQQGSQQSSSSSQSTQSTSSSSTSSSTSTTSTATATATGDVSTVTAVLPAAPSNLTAVDSSGNVLSLANQSVTTASGLTQALSSSTVSTLGGGAVYNEVLLVYPYTTGGPSFPQTPTLGGPGLNLSRDASGNLTGFTYSGSSKNVGGLNIGSGAGNVQVTATQSGSTMTDFGSDAATGLAWGRWQGGQVSGSAQYYGTDASGNSGYGANNSSGAFVIGGTQNESVTLGSASLHWITGLAPTPSYLSQVLTGTANYTLLGGTHPTDLSGNVGTLGGATLNVNFGLQTATADVNFSIGGNSWTMQSGTMQLNGDGQFNAYTNCASKCFSSVSVTKNGVNVSSSPTPTGFVLGTMNGYLTGTGLNGAALEYAVQDFGVPPPAGTNAYNLIQGVAALSGPTQNVNTPFRAVGTEDGWNDLGNLLGAGGTPPPQYHGNINGGQQAPADVVDSSAGLTAFLGQAAGYTAANSSVTVPSPQSPQLAAVKIGTAVNADVGSTSIGGITVSWGRWAGGTIDVYTPDGSTLLGTIDNSNRSVHWVDTSVLTSDFNAMPASGTATYTVAGNTSPTDFRGNVGTLTSATLNADFANLKVNAGINVSFNASTNTSSWALTANNIPLTGADFKTGTSQNGINGVATTVTCSGASCSGQTVGSLEGHFISGAQGAVMLYSMAGGTLSASSFTPAIGVTGLVVMKH